MIMNPDVTFRSLLNAPGPYRKIRRLLYYYCQSPDIAEDDGGDDDDGDDGDDGNRQDENGDGDDDDADESALTPKGSKYHYGIYL